MSKTGILTQISHSEAREGAFYMSINESINVELEIKLNCIEINYSTLIHGTLQHTDTWHITAH